MAFSIHVLYTILLSAWFGTVAAVNFVFIPAMGALSVEHKAQWIGTFFPRLFRTVTIAASVIVAVAVLSAVCGNMPLFADRVSFGLIVFLFFFHVVVERKLRPFALSFRGEYEDATVEKFHKYLRIVPRFGLTVITLAFILHVM